MSDTEGSVAVASPPVSSPTPVSSGAPAESSGGSAVESGAAASQAPEFGSSPADYGWEGGAAEAGGQETRRGTVQQPDARLVQLQRLAAAEAARRQQLEVYATQQQFQQALLKEAADLREWAAAERAAAQYASPEQQALVEARIEAAAQQLELRHQQQQLAWQAQQIQRAQAQQAAIAQRQGYIRQLIAWGRANGVRLDPRQLAQCRSLEAMHEVARVSAQLQRAGHDRQAQARLQRQAGAPIPPANVGSPVSSETAALKQFENGGPHGDSVEAVYRAVKTMRQRGRRFE